MQKSSRGFCGGRGGGRGERGGVLVMFERNSDEMLKEFRASFQMLDILFRVLF